MRSDKETRTNTVYKIVQVHLSLANIYSDRGQEDRVQNHVDSINELLERFPDVKVLLKEK